ncbi:hypothetical protein XU18_2422 [Perkinsela sp. CCAP 1560/4]|nr:hypothetical protein XU18_2422 [Perkinsela sp. CCAP 1560/4]|eukprot:KNH06820.1 hypothetical protein XU18_2422 [Perkinsela sp. CCAP 1560/4]
MMENVIPVINELQDLFSRVDPHGTMTLMQDFSQQLPQIAVVGSQSSGKSSVLESIVGKAFLPRGSGIVTRRPLILQLVPMPTDVSSTVAEQPFGEFLHEPGKKYYDFDRIREVISEETDSIAGVNKNISPEPIRLRIHSPSVAPLTLVDLPGLVRNPIGDQPKDIDRQVSNLVRKYIVHENTLILAVSAANADIATSDGVQLAQQVDPHGRRTIGVLTKLDLMEEGTHVVDIIEQRVISLQRGFIPVVNMSQSDLDQGSKTMADQRRAELQFFAQHPRYAPMRDRCGMAFLQAKLSAVLLEHVQQALPKLRTDLDGLIRSTADEIERCGGSSALACINDAPQAAREKVRLRNAPNATLIDQSAALLSFITKFTDDFTGRISGNGGNLLPDFSKIKLDQSDASTLELHGGARIHQIFHDRFMPYITALRASDMLKAEDIRQAILNTRGVRASQLLPFGVEQAFEQLYTRQVQCLVEPIMRCVRYVYDEVVHIACASCKHIVSVRFPTLKTRMLDATIALVTSQRPLLESHLRTNLEAEVVYMNVSKPEMVAQSMRALTQAYHSDGPRDRPPAKKPAEPDAGLLSFPTEAPSRQPEMTSFTQETQGVKPAVSPIELQSSTERSIAEDAFLRGVIDAHFSGLQRTVADQVPKLIVYYLIHRVTTEIRNHLVEKLYVPDRMQELMEEDPAMMDRRKSAVATFCTLLEAKECLLRAEGH